MTKKLLKLLNNGLVLATDYGTCTITCRAADGSGVYAECQVKVAGITDGHEWVDLGLPSGTLWATCNVGANSSEEYGEYFAWGETIPKDKYSWETYKYSKGNEWLLTKYCTDSEHGYNGFLDNKTELEPEDDAAATNWGSKWKMASNEQFDELISKNNTTITWTTENGVYGSKITSKSNGKHIFLPAAGLRRGTELHNAGSCGEWWLPSMVNDYGFWVCLMTSDRSGTIGRGQTILRCDGRSIRPVLVQTK